jgi:hypothetical protein
LLAALLAHGKSLPRIAGFWGLYPPNSALAPR